MTKAKKRYYKRLENAAMDAHARITAVNRLHASETAKLRTRITALEVRVQCAELRGQELLNTACDRVERIERIEATLRCQGCGKLINYGNHVCGGKSLNPQTSSFNEWSNRNG